MTIKDIARLSGYGISTVSRALNNHPDISEETKAKIKKIAEENKFEPNTNAKQLKQQGSKNIIILVKGTMNIFFAAIIKQMQNEIIKANYTALIHYIDEDINEVKAAEKLCRERKPLGILFLGGNMQTFQQRFSAIKVPSVLATTIFKDLHYDNLSCVGVDDVAAAELATRYLVEKGHKNIGVIGGNLEVSYISSLRFQGCQNILSQYGLSFHKDSYQKANYNLESSYQAMNKLLSRNPDVTAVFCMSDIMAIGAVRAIKDAGLSVPEDISVVGFDGTVLSKFYIPKITTIAQPQNEIASISVKRLLSQIEKEDPAQNMVVGFQLAEGESVRAL